MRAGVQSGGGAALPGMIFNQSKKVTYTDAVTGQDRSVYAGRMECTMQVCLSNGAAGCQRLCTCIVQKIDHSLACQCMPFMGAFFINKTLPGAISTSVDTGMIPLPASRQKSGRDALSSAKHRPCLADRCAMLAEPGGQPASDL